MKRFKFRLEKVMQHRGQVRDERKQTVQKIRAQIFELENKVQELANKFNAIQEQPGVILLAEQLFINSSFKERLKQETLATKNKIAIKNKELEEATEAYVIASQEMRAVEMLRERKLQQFNEGVEKAESASLDEMSTLRFNRP